MKIGITFSAFDLLHAGHIKMLEDAKRNAII
jgi:glycerol-3-phosphate cytidylyltransferase